MHESVNEYDTAPRTQSSTRYIRSMDPLTLLRDERGNAVWVKAEHTVPNPVLWILSGVAGVLFCAIIWLLYGDLACFVSLALLIVWAVLSAFTWGKDGK